MPKLADIRRLLQGAGLLQEVLGAAPPEEPDSRQEMAPAEWEIDVTGADCDSRLVASGHVFFCKGAHFEPRFLAMAVEAGACAWVAERSVASAVASAGLATPAIPAFVVSDIRRAMALVSAEAWGHPDRDVVCVGITGTKGKTTTARYLRAILEAAGRPCAFVGTHETFDGLSTYESPNTTPEAPELWRILAHAREAGLSACVMEVSSQALKYDRTLGLHLFAAAFLNIGNDHISPIEHPSYEDYVASKLKIFELTDHAVVNLGTKELDRVLDAARRAGCEPITFGVAEGGGPGDSGMGGGRATGVLREADYLAWDIDAAPGSTAFTARTPEGERRIRLAMDGAFNVENALCALALADLLEVPQEVSASALATARVPGRMETFASADGRFASIVDYAHNDISYQRFFEAVEASWPGARVVSAFGVSGGKALDRYADLPRIASAHSDAIVLTSDDPGEEDPERLLQLMAANVADGVPYVAIADREAGVEEAFRQALDLWRRGERVVLCLLGKGRENYLYVKGGDIPIENDGDHAERLMREAGLMDSPPAAPSEA